MAAGFSSRIWRYDPAAPAWVMLDATGPRGRYDDALASMDPIARDDLYDSAVARRSAVGRAGRSPVP